MQSDRREVFHSRRSADDRAGRHDGRAKFYARHGRIEGGQPIGPYDGQLRAALPPSIVKHCARFEAPAELLTVGEQIDVADAFLRANNDFLCLAQGGPEIGTKLGGLDSLHGLPRERVIHSWLGDQ